MKKNHLSKLISLLILGGFILPLSTALGQEGSVPPPSDTPPTSTPPQEEVIPAEVPAEPTPVESPTPAPVKPETPTSSAIATSTLAEETRPASTTPTPAPTPTLLTQTSQSQSSTKQVASSPEEETSNPLVWIALAALAVLPFGYLGARLLKGKKVEKKEERGEEKNGDRCFDIKKLLDKKLEELTNLKGKLESKAQAAAREKIKEAVEDTKAGELLALVESAEKEYGRLKKLYEECIISASGKAVAITYFVHGTTVDNEKSVSSGWSDVELSELGMNQSVALRDQIKDKKFDVVFCSDLKRAVDSAKLTFGETVKIIPDARLRECNYGAYNGQPSNIVEALQEKAITEKMPNGESCEDVKIRIADFLAFLKENYTGKKVAIVAHKTPQLALEVLINGKTWEQAFAEDWRKTQSWKPGWEYGVS